MAEAQWLASEDPRAMLTLLESSEDWDAIRWRQGCGINRISDRKLRMFAAACCRMIPPRGDDWPYFLLAVGDLEDAADVHPFLMSGLARKYFHPEWDAPTLADWAAMGVKGAAGALRDIVGNPYKPVTLPYVPDGGRVDGVLTGSGRIARHLAVDQWEFADHCPWRTPQVMDLAAAAYEHRQGDGALDPFRLALLADALEEAGCDSETILQHLRGFERCPPTLNSPIGWRQCGPHFRGCWAVDLILGKE